MIEVPRGRHPGRNEGFAVPAMVTWREREARNEAGFRDQNEWIGATSDSFGAEPSVETFVCECGDGDCTETIQLTRAEYESVRATSTHFAVAPNHENPESEGVVSECARFAVVDKVEGWGLRIARATDPRSARRPRLVP
jgi:hypothetical protein